MSNIVTIDTAPESEKQRILAALGQFSEQTSIDTSKLQSAIKNNEIETTRKLASDIFCGDPFNGQRRFELYNDTLKGIGHTGIAGAFGDNSKETKKEEKDKQFAHIIFQQTLVNIEKTYAIIDEMMRKTREEIEKLEIKIAKSEEKAEKIKAQIDEKTKELETEETRNAKIEKEMEEVEEKIDQKTEEIKEKEKELEEYKAEFQNTDPELNGKTPSELKEKLNEQKDFLQILDDNINEFQKYLDKEFGSDDTDRHEYMKRKYSFSISILGYEGKVIGYGEEDIRDVSKDENRIAKYIDENGQSHFVSYDPDSKNLFYEQENEDGQLIKIDVPTHLQARIWFDAYKNSLIFENERFTGLEINDLSFKSLKDATKKTYEFGESFFSENLDPDKILEGLSKKQKKIIGKLENKIAGTTEGIQAKEYELKVLMEELKKFKNVYESLKEEYENGTITEDKLKHQIAELNKEYNDVVDVITAQKQELDLLHLAEVTYANFKKKENLEILHEVLYNDDTNTITAEELEKLKPLVDKRLHGAMIKQLRDTGITVELPEENNSPKAVSTTALAFGTSATGTNVPNEAQPDSDQTLTPAQITNDHNTGIS